MQEQLSLSKDKINHLQYYLEKLSPKYINNIEMLDGFIVSLLCCPELIKLEEFVVDILGRKWKIFENLEDADIFFDLLSDYWDGILLSLQNNNFVPIFRVKDGQALGNDWASGFVRGMKHRPAVWEKLRNNKEHWGVLFPIYALADEKTTYSDSQPFKAPLTIDQRNHLLTAVVNGVKEIYEFFRPHLNSSSTNKQFETIYFQPNSYCFCGSGKRYTECCSKITRH